MVEYVANNPGDKVYWQVVKEDDDDQQAKGEMVFTFDPDGQKTYNLFHDYPWELTPEEKKIFDEENPFWADFFADREYDHGR